MLRRTWRSPSRARSCGNPSGTALAPTRCDASLGSSARFSQCGSYAQTNRMWVASCNAVSGSFYGNSCIYAPWGEPLVQLPHDEEALGVAVLNLALCGDWPIWRDRLDFSGLPCSGPLP